MVNSFYGSRVEGFEYQLLDQNDNIIGSLDSVQQGGSLDFSISAEVRGSGSITITKTKDINWLTSRVRVSYLWDDLRVPLITALPRIPSEQYGDATTLKVDLKDKLSILVTDSFGYSYSVATGVNIIDAAKSVLSGQRYNIPASTATLSAGMVWEPNATKLRIINDLLAAANYFSLSCDGLGNFFASPYTDPKARPVMWTFEDLKGRGSYLPNFVRNYDPYSVPNKVVTIGKSTGDTEALTGSALDYTSPYGYNARGFWITEVMTDVEGDLNAQALRQLNNQRSVYETFDITHPYLPFSIYGHENRVTFKNAQTQDYDALCQKQSWNLNEGGLIKTNLRVIV